MQAQLKLILTIILFTCTSFTVLAQEDKQDEVKTKGENKKESSKESQEKSNATIPSPVSIEKQHKADLSHYFPTNRVAPILAGPDDYLTLVNENTSVNNKGVAILIPD